MNPPNSQEIPEDSPDKLAMKLKVRAFFGGCGAPRCIHAGCAHFMGPSEFAHLREAPDEKTVAEVIGLIEKGTVDVDCAVRENPLAKLPEAFQVLPTLFAWDFNRLLNATSAERLAYFEALEAEVTAKLAGEELEFRMTTLLYFEEYLKADVLAFARLLRKGVRDFDLFETLLVFFCGFELIFDFETFQERLSLQEVFLAADFPVLLPADLSRLRASPLAAILTRSRLARFTETLQNLLALCYPFGQFLTATGSLRRSALTLLCRSLHFLLHLNTLLPRAQRLPLKDFTNATLSEDYSNQKAVLGFVKAHPGHPLQPLLAQLAAEEDSLDEINFMSFPFLFSVDRRVDVLNLESDLFQKTEMFGGASGGNLFNLLLGGSLFLSIKLRRASLLEDALSQLSSGANRANLRKQLKVTFVGEPGVDEGGVKKEFFGLLTDQLFDPNFGMFLVKNDRFLWFNQSSFECRLNFELVGTLLGLALYNEVILSLRFPLAVYKKLIAAGSAPVLVSDRLELDDLQEIEPDVHRTLANLLAKDWTGRDTGLTFSVTHEVFGEVREWELAPGGASTVVTEANKVDFVDKYLDWYFNASVREQFDAFATGFFRVLLKNSFTLFAAEDLQLALCGSTVLDFHQLKKTATYENYSATSETVGYFWSILLDDFDDSQRRLFLKFLTGSDRSPIRGLGDIRMIVTKTGDSDSLPSAHTCFNHLILPDYRNPDKLRAKLLKAIENSEGFGLF